MLRELGLPIRTGGVVVSYQVADGQTWRCAWCLDGVVIQLHDELAQNVECVLVTDNEEPMCILGNNVLSFAGNPHV